MGLCIKRVAHRGQFAEHRVRILPHQERARLPPPDPRSERLNIGIKPDGERVAQNEYPGFVVDEGPAPCCKHARGARNDARDHAPLTVAERRFTKFGKNIGDGHAGGLFNFIIGVDEIHIETRRQPPSDSRFSCPHKPDQHHAFRRVGRAGGKGLAFRVSRHDSGGYTAVRTSDKGTIEIMQVKSKRIFWWASAAALAIALPVVAQESLLPEGFGDPAPAPSERPSPTPAPSPSAKGGTPTSPAAAPANGAFVSETAEGEDTAAATEEAAAPGILRYDLPPGARRSLERIGPLTAETGGLASTSFGVRGQYVARIMRGTDAPIASRWASIILRRALVSAIDTPATINGADLAAERAALLLRMGEAGAARLIVQAVDADRGTPRLAQVAMQTMMANADPAGLCPWTNLGLGRTKDEHSWRLAAGMCAALSSEPGPAGWAVDKVRNAKGVSNFDILLTERVLGATLTGRRAVTIQWEGINQLTSWRFGLATATGTPIPAPLRRAAPPEMAGWGALAPMTPLPERVTLAEQGALRGVLSGDAYVALVAAAAAEADAPETISTLAAELGNAYGASSADARFAAMQKLWQAAPDADRRYAAMVLTARAAAALPVGTDVGDDAPWLIGAMLAGGYDRNALAWVPTVGVGSHAWGLMAVGLPRPLIGVDAGTVGDFAGDDDSADGLRSKFLVAGLAGLDRLKGEALQSAAADVEVALGTQSRWTRAIDDAAARGEPGTVALLVATGMQSRDWTKVPPHHLYRMVRALREVGLASEARMLAAEALVRV
jgi:hypothetical protein